MLTRFASASLILCAAAFAGGCQSYYFTDSVDLELNFAPLIGHGDDLHSPYVTGAHFTVWAESSDGDENKSAWSIESSDPAVLRVETDTNGEAEGVAVAPGTAAISVRDGAGELLHRESI